MDPLINNCTGVILAGGENTRMPVTKAFIEVGGKSIIERSISIFEKLFSEIYVVTNQPERYVHLGAILLGDVYDIRGPMTGVFTSLLNSSSKWIFVCANDMPFISEHLISYMAAKITSPKPAFKKGAQGVITYSLKSNVIDAVVPRIKGKAEPLFAFYSKRLLTSMERHLLSGNTGLTDFLHNSVKRVKYISSKEIDTLDPKARNFINLNSPGDVFRYLQKKDIIKFKAISERRGKCLA